MDPRTYPPCGGACEAEALRRDRGLCVRCLPGLKAAMSVHHITHLADGGDPFALENLQSLCAKSAIRKLTANEKHRPAVVRPRDFECSKQSRRKWRSASLRTRLLRHV